MVEKHDFNKFETHVDFFAIFLLKDTMSQQEFNRITNKYLMDEDADVYLKATMRSAIVDRMGELKAFGAYRRHLNRLGELLDDGKYATV